MRPRSDPEKKNAPRRATVTSSLSGAVQCCNVAHARILTADHGESFRAGKFESGGGARVGGGAESGAARGRDYADRGVEDASGGAYSRGVRSGIAALWGESRAGVGREARRG